MRKRVIQRDDTDISHTKTNRYKDSLHYIIITNCNFKFKNLVHLRISTFLLKLMLRCLRYHSHVIESKIFSKDSENLKTAHVLIMASIYSMAVWVIKRGDCMRYHNLKWPFEHSIEILIKTNLESENRFLHNSFSKIIIQSCFVFRKKSFRFP